MESVLRGKTPAGISTVIPLDKYSIVIQKIQNRPARIAQAHLDWVKLAFLDSGNGALVSASTAGNAGVSVDLVLAVALSDSGNGALISTSAAGDTSISNNVSHGITSKIILMRYV